MHLSDGEIRAYLDEGNASTDPGRIHAHLEACAQCQERAQRLRERGGWMSQRLESLEAQPSSVRPAAAVRPRLRAYLKDKEKTPMLKRIFSRPYRTAWVALGVIAVLAIALAFPPVQAIANSFLGLFRIQRVTVVEVNPANLPEQLGSSSQLETFLTDSIQFEELGEVQDAADAAQASQMAGIPVRLPGEVEGELLLKVHPGVHMRFTVDLPRVQAILDEIGRGDIRLPKELDGATVTVDASPSVAAMYGDCQADLENAREQGFDPDSQEMPRLPHCTTLVQMPSPEVNAPPGLNVAQVGEAYLQLLGMTAEEAQAFSQSVDWTSTFVVPIPRYGTSTETVSVDGVEGAFIQQDLRDHAKQYLLMWVKEGILYALTGPGGLEDALRVAGSIQ
jgi:hypothetical protein